MTNEPMMYRRDRRMERDRRPRMEMDRRNPYGSRGGYVTTRRPDRRSTEYDEYDYSPRYDREYDYGYGTRESTSRDYNYDHGSTREYSGYYGDTPFRMNARSQYYPYDMRRDYSDGQEDYLSDREIEEWTRRLLNEVDEKDKDMLHKEKVMKRAEEMGIKYDKFTPEEYYLVVLMTYTDYSKTLGNANIDTYLRLAKDWMCDDDIRHRYSDKLALYYDYIVM